MNYIVQIGGEQYECTLQVADATLSDDDVVSGIAVGAVAAVADPDAEWEFSEDGSVAFANGVPKLITDVRVIEEGEERWRVSLKMDGKHWVVLITRSGPHSDADDEADPVEDDGGASESGEQTKLNL
jgi:hypothetical protein